MVAALFLLSSCLKDQEPVSSPESYTTNANYSEIFQSFWNGMNNQYVFWDIDSTNWDSIYRVYQPKFASLTDNPFIFNDSAYVWFMQMTSRLLDSHYSIAFYVNNMPEISPSTTRYQSSSDYHPRIPYNHFFDTIPKYYIDPATLVKDTVHNSTLANNNHVRIVTGTAKGKALYFGFSSFYLYNTYLGGDPVARVTDTFFSRLQHLPSNIKAIILDVRNNNGGAVIDLDFLSSHFLVTPLHFGYTRSKNGNGRLDYAPWEKAIAAGGATSTVSVPIIILVDNYSVSMAELTTMAFRTVPGSTVVGEHTWGANGPLITDKYYDDGQFYIGINLGSFNTQFNSYGFVYTSSVEFNYLNHRNYESKGFPPDHPVKYNQAALKMGDDPQLDSALALVP